MVEPGLDKAAWLSIADSLPAMLFTAGADGRLEYVSRQWIEFTGQDHAENDAGWSRFVDPDDLPQLEQLWQNARVRHEPIASELRLRTPEGAHRWVLLRAAPLREPPSSIVRWCGIAVDVDERRQAVDALRESETQLADSRLRFHVLAEAIPVICWTAGPDGRGDWFNRRYYEFTGQAADEALGWGWQATQHPDDFLDVMQRWPESVASGRPLEMEFRLRRRDGVFHWFLARAEPQRDPDGKIVRWYGSYVDIDAQKQAMERTKRIAATLQDVFLPKALPQRHDLRIDALYLPAEKDALVGGDWFDAFELPDGRLACSIGDVAGHGLHASVAVGRNRQAIFTLAFMLEDPAAILKELDRILEHQEPETMVTALVAFVDREHTQLTFASAGHPPPLIAYRNDEPAQVLPYGEAPLAAGYTGERRTRSVPLAPDAVVAFYTDGLIEASRDILGSEKRLRSAVALLVGNTKIARPALAVKEIVLEDQATTDDAALLLLQFSAVSAELRADFKILEKTWRFHSSDASTARAARREIVTYLRAISHDANDLFSSELIVGEMLANTVKHAPGLVEVQLDWTGERTILIVRDAGPGVKNMQWKLPDDPLSEDGRGLYFIKSFAVEASAKTTAGYGTELRAVLPLSRQAERP